MGYIIALFQKKSKQGVEDMWKFQGSFKKEVEFPGVFKKNLPCGISCGVLVYLTLEFPRGMSHTILWNFHGESCFL